MNETSRNPGILWACYCSCSLGLGPLPIGNCSAGEFGWNVSETARRIGIRRTNLHERLKHHGLK